MCLHSGQEEVGAGQEGGEFGRASGDEARRPRRATASRSRAASRLRTPYGAPNHGSKSRTRAASRRRRWPTPKPPGSGSWSLPRSGLHVRSSGARTTRAVSPRTRRVPSPIFSLSRRAAAARNSGISFVLGTPPRLTGLELPYVQRTPQATGGRPPAGPTQRSQPSGHPINSIWAGY